MSETKYRLTLDHIQSPSGIHKLEHDGFSKETIMKTMYKEMPGASKEVIEGTVRKLYDRKE